MSVTFEIKGIGDVTKAFDDLANEIGDKTANSKVLVPAMREAMIPVLNSSKQNAPVDTGALLLSLQIEARRPTRKDKRSKYISSTDSVIAIVTTASGKKLQQMSQGKGLLKAQKRLKKMGFEGWDKFAGFKSDARAIAQEFGSARNPAHFYLRPALESNSQTVIQTLASALSQRIEKYRMKK